MGDEIGKKRGGGHRSKYKGVSMMENIESVLRRLGNVCGEGGCMDALSDVSCFSFVIFISLRFLKPYFLFSLYILSSFLLN